MYTCDQTAPSLTVSIGVPLYTLGEGLMIYFRKPGHSVGWIVFTQILIAIGGSSFTIVQQVAVLAVGSTTGDSGGDSAGRRPDGASRKSGGAKGCAEHVLVRR